MSVNPNIFKAYDIRGIYPDEINEEVAEKIGAAFVRYLGQDVKKIIVGRDIRLSSPSLFKAISEGITKQGVGVSDIGICTTPMLNFGLIKYGYKGGIMISASHNPAHYNGFKLIEEKGIQLAGKKIDQIKKIVLENKLPKAEIKGEVKKLNILNDYLDHILSFAKNIKEGLKIVVDYGNGVGAISARAVFKKLNLEVISIYEEPDGTFPNHLPNPHEIKFMKELQERVKKEKADLGIFFDGDADRSMMIDEKGEIVFPDLLVGFLAKEELKKYPGEKIYYDLRFSKVVKEIIKENGGVPVMMRVGNPFYKEKLILEGGALAGELSGHLMFKENFGIDDGLFAAIKTMDLICLSKKTLSELIKPLKKYFQTEEINLEVKEKDKVLNKVREYFKDGHFIELDGLYIQYPDWWFNLRKSNTEDLVRLRIEAKREKLLKEKKKELLDLIIK